MAGALATPATVQRIQLLSAYPQYVSNTGMSNSSVLMTSTALALLLITRSKPDSPIAATVGLMARSSTLGQKLLGNVDEITTNGGGVNLNGAPAFRITI